MIILPSTHPDNRDKLIAFPDGYLRLIGEQRASIVIPRTVLSARWTSSSQQVNFCIAVRAGSESDEERLRAERSNRSSIHDLGTRRNNARRLLPQSLDADSDGDCAAIAGASDACRLLFFPDASAPPKVSQMSYRFKSGGLFYDVRCSIPSYQVSFRSARSFARIK